MRRTALSKLRWTSLSRHNRESYICSSCLRGSRRSFVSSAATPYAAAAPEPLLTSFLGQSLNTGDDAILREIFDHPHRFLTPKTSLSTPKSGLFQNKYLTTPQGFSEFANKCIERAKRLEAKVINARTPDELKKVVKDLDRLSDLLCRVTDLSEFVRNTHPDPKVVEAADEAYTVMYEFMNVLNTTTGLYEGLKRVIENAEVYNSLSSEEKTVAGILLRDFEKSGVNLPKSARDRFVELTNTISRLGHEFMNTMDAEKHHLQLESSSLKGMDPMVVRTLTRGRKVLLPTVGMHVYHALSFVQDAEVRKEVFKANRTSSRRTIALLEHMLCLRAELAKLDGKNSFAEMTLLDKMAKTPEAVRQFLNSLAQVNRPTAMEEIKELTRLKRDMTGFEEPLMAWDYQYYHTELQRKIASSSPRKGDIFTGETLSAFFSLGTVMQGLSRLFTNLYGVRLVPREPQPGETWSSDVRRLDVISEDDGHIAVLYCDLFTRTNKSHNPSHFTIRCSRLIEPDEMADETGEAGDGMAMARRREDGALFQLPTIALVCDFSSTSASQPPLLPFTDVCTLFHEMGHAIHSCLGRTKLHNVAGTRCATDFSELPSVLMERFASSPEVLGMYARHWKTDEPLPWEMMEEHLRATSLCKSSEVNDQICMSVLDQELHSSVAGDVDKFDSTAIYSRLQGEMGLVPPVKGTSSQGFFSHLYGYGGVYYSYLFDKVIADMVWQQVFSSDPLSRESGEKMKSEVLKWGGSRDPWKCVAGLLGKEHWQEGGVEAMEEIGKWGNAVQSTQ